MRQKEDTVIYNWRYHLLIGALLLVSCGIIIRTVQLHVFEVDFLIHEGDKRYLRSEALPAHRGVIYDRQGKPLAVSTPVTTVWFNPKQLIESPEQWRKLARAAGKPFQQLRDKIVKYKHKEFLYLRRHMSPDAAEKILELKIPGVYSMREYRRYYPAGEVAAHIVGFTNIDDRGQEGMELAYEKQLRGYPGSKRVVKDRTGRVVKDLGIVESPRPGSDLHLSLDLRVQYLAYQELLSTVKKHRAAAGSIVVVDVKTGEIIASANQPAYNPNNRKNINTSSLRNRAFTDVFEPGSTVKPFTVAAALESKQYFPATKIKTLGYMPIGRKLIRDHRNYGEIDVTAVLTKSSNIGATKLALSLPNGDLAEMFGRVGLGRHQTVGFPGESRGNLPIRHKWRDIETATLSYGYGLSVTAVQLAHAYSVLANKGIKKPLSLLKLEELTGNQELEGEAVLNPRYANQVVKMLETVVTPIGTAKRAAVPGYRVAGKTGTVHKLKDGAYSEDRYLALFAGFAPVEDPAFVMVVIIDDPKGEEYFGGEVAAPVFSKVMEGILRMQNITPDRPESEWMMASKLY
ncbi:MAG: penicillin-binding protein 2 [Pseudomonadales bacterium]|nr:penicillin-binding protein 2 [Pseudomonadales bacterium]